MGLFTKPATSQPTLQQQHEQADALGARALGIFRTVANDLNVAAEQHVAVADQAQAVIDEHTRLRDAANAAATDKVRQADAISALVS